MSDKIKLQWVTRLHTVAGNALGYNSHNKSMLAHAPDYFDLTDDAKIALHIVPADGFVPIPNKINVLFTMWEFFDLPNIYVKGIDKADAIIVPSKFCKDVFKKYTKKPIYVCHEGVEASKYPYHRRYLGGGKRFRYLWVGAPNPRKGYPLITQACKIFENTQDAEIYIKTTMPKMDIWQTLKAIWKNRNTILFDKTERGKRLTSLARMIRRIPKPQLNDRVQILGKNKNIILDTRVLPFEELVELYNSAHCFLLPTFGEGWGLTLCEAMATGCPSIATAVTGCADFFDDEVGYSLKYTIQDQEMRDYEVKTKGYVPDVHDLVQKMIYVATHYGEAVKKGKKAHERITKKFTWDLATKRLRDIIVDIQDEVGNV